MIRDPLEAVEQLNRVLKTKQYALEYEQRRPTSPMMFRLLLGDQPVLEWFTDDQLCAFIHGYIVAYSDFGKV